MDIAEDAKRIIAKSMKIEPSELRLDTKLSEMAMDSLDFVEMIFELEEKFNVDIGFESKDSHFVLKTKDGSETQDVSFSTVGQVIDIVQKIVDRKAR